MSQFTVIPIIAFDLLRPEDITLQSWQKTRHVLHITVLWAGKAIMLRSNSKADRQASVCNL